MDNQNQQQESSSMPPVPEPVESLRHKRNWKKWIWIYAVIAVILFGGVYYFVISKHYTRPYVISDQIAEWKTYENKEVGFSFSYPSELEYIEDQLTLTNEEGLVGYLRLTNDKKFAYGYHETGKENPPKLKLVISIFKSPEFSIDKQVEKIKSNPNNSLKNYQIVDLDSSLKAIRYSVVYRNQESAGAEFVYKNYLFTMSLNHTGVDPHDILFDQILSTFRFTR